MGRKPLTQQPPANTCAQGVRPWQGLTVTRAPKLLIAQSRVGGERLANSLANAELPAKPASIAPGHCSHNPLPSALGRRGGVQDGVGAVRWGLAG